ncbi:MAG: right-handed parallel beta-helix repeat-containing protein [Phycisphaerae bacterium]
MIKLRGYPIVVSVWCVLLAAASDAAILRVRAGASGNGDGSTWNDAFPHLSTALAAAQTGDEIWVAAGTYRPDESAANPNGTGDRTLSFILRSGVAVYGGFAGNEIALAERDFGANLTILSGDLDPVGGLDGPNFTNYGDNSDHVLTAHGVATSAVLDGMTVRGGDAPAFGTNGFGGGLFAIGGSPTLRNCIFAANRAASGGGIELQGFCAATLQRVTLADNAATSAHAGLSVEGNSGGPYASVLIENCTFVRNLAPLSGAGAGGGLSSGAANTTVRDCIFDANVAARGAGIITGGEGTLNISGCLFLRNFAGGPATFCSGGGIRIAGNLDQVTIQGCSFYGNRATNAAADGEGGGIYVSVAADATLISSCTFVGNTANRGGGVRTSNPSTAISNCTLISNVALQSGGGVGFLATPTNGSLWNSIVWANIDAFGGGSATAQIEVAGPPATISYSIVQGGFAGTEIDDADPALRENPSPGADGVWDGNGDSYGDLRPSASSAAIDAGNNAFLAADRADLDGDGDTTEPAPYDIGRRARLRDFWSVVDQGVGSGAIVDIGAYEHVGGEILVSNDPSLTPWPPEAETDSLAAALNFAGEYADEVSEIWIAAGVYTPDFWPGVVTPGDRAATFELPSGVAVYGGFAGDETDLAQRDIAANVSILSGDLTGGDQYYDPTDGTPFVGYNENSYHVVSATTGLAERILDGVTVRGGYAHSSGAILNGAGVYATSGALTIRNCTFRENRSAQPGGAVYHSTATQATLLIDGCLFERNQANANGGAAVFSSGSSALDVRNAIVRRNTSAGAISAVATPNARVADCLFEQNLGSALVLWRRPRAVIRCDFIANRSPGSGGAVFLTHTPGPTADFVSCRFIGNMATGPASDPDSGGGAIFSKSTSSQPGSILRATNCVFVGNTAVRGGAVMLANHDLGGGSASFINCSFAENVAATDGGGIWAGTTQIPGGTSSFTVRNSIFWNNRDSGPLDETAQIFVASGTPTVTDSLIRGGWTNPDGNRIISFDPLFTRSPSPGGDGLWDGVNDDYGDLRLYRGSPAIDLANLSFVPTDITDLDDDLDVLELTPLDIDGNARFLQDGCLADRSASPPDFAADLGAYERVASPGPAQAVVYVDGAATGADNGTNWDDAYTDLADALCRAANGVGVQELWVAAGTYQPTSRGERIDSFILPPGLAIYGGFAGDELLRDERDPAANLTILTGDRAGDDSAIPFDPLTTPPATWNENAAHVVRCVRGTGWTLDGFTITRGFANLTDGGAEDAKGGGLWLIGSDGTIRNCRVFENATNASGGGAHVGRYTPGLASDVAFESCVFERNRAAQYGGGMRYGDGIGTLNDCLFTTNIAGLGGGGALLDGDGKRTIRRTHFLLNQAQSSAGGADSGGANDFIDCTFERNSLRSAGSGGGLYASERVLNVVGCRFVGNSAGGGFGGALRVPNGNVRVATFTAANCLFIGNTAGSGGAITVPTLGVAGSTASIVNCTFSENVAISSGGGIICGAQGNNAAFNPSITNCVFWNNRDAGGTDESAQIHVTTGAPIVNYSLVQGDWSGAGDVGIVAGNPRVLRAPSPGIDGFWNGVNDDYGDLRLGYGSPAIDSGDSTALPIDSADIDADGNTTELLPIDAAGLPRQVDEPCATNSGVGSPPTDMGAHERAFTAPTQTVLYVNSTADGATDGTTWADAFVDLQSALCAARNSAGIVREIWVAAGTYKPEIAGGSRASSFGLLSGVALYGGFAGNEFTRAQRDAAINVTILSGDLTGNDQPADEPGSANYTENSLHVVDASSTDETAILDGFTIRGGFAKLPDTDSGGGLYVNNGSPTIVACAFESNAGSNGGAVGVRGNSNPTLTDCRFIKNRANEPTVGDGGAIYSFAVGTIALRDCVFEENLAVDGGGAISVAVGTSALEAVLSRFERNRAARGAAVFLGSTNPMELVSCRFIANTAAAQGGGLALQGASPAIVNCIFVGNTAATGTGGAIYSTAGSPLLLNCSLASNSAQSGGALWYSGIATAPRVANSILWGNVDTTLGTTTDQIFRNQLDLPPLILRHTIIQGGWVGSGDNNTTANPLFARTPSDGGDGWGIGIDDPGDLALLDMSPGRNTGDNSELPPDAADIDCDGDRGELMPLDLKRGPRVTGTPQIVERGALEEGGGASSRIYVKAGATGLGDGSSWDNAYPELREALNFLSIAGCTNIEVWVAAGTYKPGTSRASSFQLADGVTIIGGLVGDEIALPPARDAALTVLSGDLDDNDAGQQFNDNCYHVIRADQTTALAVLDGFTIRGGNADGSGRDNSAGGILIGSGSPAIRNCIITANRGACASSIDVNGGAPALHNVIIDGAVTQFSQSFAQSQVDLTEAWTPGGVTTLFGTSIVGTGTLQLPFGGELRVSTSAGCAAETVIELAATLAATQVYAPAVAGLLPARWEVPAAQLSNVLVRGPVTSWVIAPAGTPAAALTWTGHARDRDLSSAGRARSRFSAGSAAAPATLTITGDLYDRPPAQGGTLLHSGELLVCRVGAFEVRETTTSSDTLAFATPPVMTPIGGYLVGREDGLSVGGALRLSMNFATTAAPLSSFGTSAIELGGTSVVGALPLAPPSPVSNITSDIRGTGNITIERGATLALAGEAVLNLSGMPDDVCVTNGQIGAPPGGIVSVNGALLVRDQARVRNTRVEVNALTVEDGSTIVRNNLSLLESTSGFGGEFFVSGDSTIACNNITSYGDRYLDLDPDPTDGSQPLVENNRIKVIIAQGAGSTQGELLELRTRDIDLGVGNGASGAFQLPPGGSAGGYNDSWSLDELIITAGAKVTLTNRQGFRFQPANVTNPEALYVRHITLESGATLNTGLQRVYYQTMSMAPDAHIVDIPLLGFSLKVIGFDDATLPPNNEVDVRLKRRLEDPSDAQPTDPSQPRKRGSCERITHQSDPIVPLARGGVLDMRTQAIGLQSALSIAAHGSFARAGDERVTVAFEYQFVSTSSNAQAPTELVVYLTESPESRSAANAAQFVELARISPPRSGLPGSPGAPSFAVFADTFPAGELNFRRGTYVELELRGEASRVHIDNFDPHIDCSDPQCRDFTGDGAVTERDLLTLLSSYGQALSLAEGNAAGTSCVDNGMTRDGYLDIADIIAWDALAFDPDALGTCGDGAPQLRGPLPGCDGVGGITVPESGLIVLGKTLSPDFTIMSGARQQRLYFLDDALSCGAPSVYPPIAPAADGAYRACGRIITGPFSQPYVLHALQGLIRACDGKIVVPPTSSMFGSSTVHIHLQSQPVPGNSGAPLGVPIADAAFSPTEPNIVYVAPVLVSVPGGPLCTPQISAPLHHYRAAAQLRILPGCDVQVEQLYGFDPYCDPDRNALPPEASAIDTQRIREIEVDAFGNVFVLACKTTLPPPAEPQLATPANNEWLLVYPTSGGQLRIPLQTRFPESTSAPQMRSPSAMYVSRTPCGSPSFNKLLLTSAINDSADGTRIYRMSIIRGSKNTVTDVIADGVIELSNIRHVASLVERLGASPSGNRILAVGFDMPQFPADRRFTDLEDMECAPRVANFSADLASDSTVVASDLLCEDLAMPMSAAIVDGCPPSCPGDVDGDNDVDLTDLATLLSNYGTPSGAGRQDGDLDGNGAVNLTDLANLLAVFGTACES